MNFVVVIATMVVFIGALQPTSAAVMPDYVKTCSRNDPQLNECVKNTVHALRPHLKDGIKELNVPALEPLHLGDLHILDGGSAGLNFHVKNLKVFGASNFELKKIKSSNNGLQYDFELDLPRLQGEGIYNLEGKILALPLQGNGPFVGNFTDFFAFVKVVFKPKKLNDIDYLDIKELAVKIRTGKGRLRLQNLFNGDKSLGDVVNDTINQNFELFTNELIGPIERALEKKFVEITQTILDNFTYDELFPSKP